MLTITDTFPVFLSYWYRYRNLDVSQQISGWKSEYLHRWPWLFQKQVDDYKEYGENWETIASEKVFPFISERFSGMAHANDVLIENIRSIHESAEITFDLHNFDVHYVTYVGLGCGAGWVTTVNGEQAVLFGLEMAAECGWTDTDSLRGLIAHEIGHAVHGFLRNDFHLSGGSGPLWRLYIEGFAANCEETLIHPGSRHESIGYNPPDWLQWCSGNRRMLAGKFLREASAGGDCRDFFGSWYNIQGYKQCGYWLGREIFSELTIEKNLRELALIRDVNIVMGKILKSFLLK